MNFNINQALNNVKVVQGPPPNMYDQASSNSRRSYKYREYSLQDYKMNDEKTKSVKLGGLGANVGSDKWELAQKKKI